MKKLYMSAYFICVVLSVPAQEVLWQKDIKSSTQDFLSQVTPTVDLQYLITGSSIQSQKLSTESKQNNGYDYHLVKLNQRGEEVWEKYFSGMNHDYLSTSLSTQDGGFLLAGTSFSGKGLDKEEDSNGGSDIWVIRINELGDELWQKTIGTSSDEEAKSVIQTTDLGFFVAGNVQNSEKGYGSKDVIIVKLDKNGKEISQMILGGKGLDEVEKMIPTKDGGVLVGMYSRSNKGGSKKTENYGEGDYWIIKLSKDGKVEWERNYGGIGDDHLRTMAMTAKGFVIGGESRSDRSGNKTVGIDEGTDIWLIALNEGGDEIWQKSYSFRNRDILMSLNVVSNAKDSESKGFLLGGYTRAEGRISENDETFWMLYLNQNGDEVWRKHINGNSRQKEERLSDLSMGRDGSIILAGTSAEEFGKENWKIVKLGDKQVEDLIERLPMKIYPNPVSDYCYAEIGFDFKDAEITIYDMAGRQIQTLTTKNKVTKINTSNMVQGAYVMVVKAHTQDNQTQTANAKLIKK
ncbi:T9SS C-terminal target domain-containing protein [Chryseobacterium pennae]|uniref:T9SS C-terminal target domain-containing protein n=1 Tax=Chryseobacterium pennae TaxID=2258962 RepID=A0A3D9C6X4_9FLAO|nr:T9SS type A sorting domain-containing protein [Chryseobacterium pennae]REC61231.1 T9SS C-terminal target domain-containing protein [Chryseobacterium pennae]